MQKLSDNSEVDSFKEVGAVGTGVVITIVESITRGSKVYKFEEYLGFDLGCKGKNDEFASIVIRE